MNMHINPIMNSTYKKLNNSFGASKKQSFYEHNYEISSLECIAKANIAFCSNKPIPVYAVSRENKIKRFENISQASSELGIVFGTIRKILKGECFESNGYTFINANEIESEDLDSSTTLKEKIIKQAKEQFECAQTCAVYAVDYDGNKKRYSSLAQASKELGIAVPAISKCALKGTHSANGYVFIFANQLEKTDKNDKPSFDNKVFRQEMKRFSKAYRGSICAIDYLGNITKYPTEKMAKDDLGNIRPCRDLDETPIMTGGKIVVSENVILKRDRFGHTMLDENGDYIYDIKAINKLLEAYNDVKMKPIKAFNVINRKTFYFENMSRASEGLGVSRQLINSCLQGRVRVAYGYKFQHLYPMKIDNYTLDVKKDEN